MLIHGYFLRRRGRYTRIDVRSSERDRDNRQGIMPVSGSHNCSERRRAEVPFYCTNSGPRLNRFVNSFTANSGPESVPEIMPSHLATVGGESSALIPLTICQTSPFFIHVCVMRAVIVD